MGCCCCKPMSSPPADVEGKVLHSTYGDHVFIVQGNNQVRTIKRSGTLFITDRNILYYTNGCISSKVVDMPLSFIKTCHHETSFSVPGRFVYYKPCCCSGCPDGLVNITADINGKEVRLAMGVNFADEFVEHINNARNGVK